MRSLSAIDEANIDADLAALKARRLRVVDEAHVQGCRCLTFSPGDRVHEPGRCLDLRARIRAAYGDAQ